ncbi:sodium-independent sulfate anion transporter-like [Osmia lignaria lignaria]|uniref:sodium-independent sulfate anion transporter-like n=1 Tax=Osmia lignaria lignaria TaxID=1437193 RepID=UPI00402B2F39
MSYERRNIEETTPLLGRNVESGLNLKQYIIRRIPILEWLPRYNLSKFLQDFLAGLTVGLTVIPQGIAYAIIAGLPAQVNF